MKKALIFDLVTLLGIALIGAGVFGRWGWPEACIAVGALLLVFPFVELLVFRRGG